MAKLLSNTRVYGTATVDTVLFVNGGNTVHSTATGAARVIGGLGVAGGGFFSGVVTATSFVGAISGTASLASDLAGGTAGQLVYQIGANDSGFVGPGTAGQILVSAGAAAPVYTNTASIYVAGAVNAQNIFGGTAGQLHYQSSAGVTAFAGPGTSGQVLTSGGTGAPVYVNTSSLHVGRAVTADSFTGTAGAATNIAGGTAGQVPYQTGASATSFFGPGTSGQILVSAGTSAPTYTNTGSIYVGRAVIADSSSGPAGSVANALTMSNAGSGAASGTTYNGSVARTISYNSIGAPGASNLTDASATRQRNSIISEDTRSTNYTPGERSAGLFADFKANSTDGLSDGGIYHGVLTFRSYGTNLTDFTGGQAKQIAYTDNNNLWHRLSTNSSTWGTWYKIIDTNNTSTAYVGRAVLADSATSASSASASTNISGGTAGQLLYQSSAGVTAFAGPGTSGQILVSAGTSAPTYTNTSSIYVNRSTLADNDAGGAAGGLRYQTGANASTFLSIGTAGQILRVNSGATAPEWISTSSLYVNRAATADNATSAGSVSSQAQTNNSNYFLTFVDSNNISAAGENLYTTSTLYVNPSTGNVGIGANAISSRLTLGTDFASIVGIAVDTGNTTDAAFVARKASSKTAYGILAWDSEVYLSAGTYYDGGSWIQNNANNNNQLFVQAPGSGVRWYASNNGSGSWNVASNIQLWDDSANWTSLVQSTRTGNSYFTGGNVGIGTSSPGSLLNLNGSNPDLIINNTSTGNSGVKIRYNGSTTHGLHLTYTPSDATAYIENTYQANAGTVYGDIYFRQNVAGTMTTRMTIKADGGNIGIGTTSPTSGKLQISSGGGTSIFVGTATRNWLVQEQASTSNFQHQALRFDDNSVPNVLRFYNNYNGANYGIGMTFYGFGDSENAFIRTIQNTSSSAAARLQLSTTGQTGINITSSGLVGINTTSPTYRLDVAGQICMHDEAQDIDDRFYGGTFLRGWQSFSAGSESSITYTTDSTSPVGVEVLSVSTYVWARGPRLRLDNTQNYEVELWVKRHVSNTAGTFYFVVSNYDSNGGVLSGDGTDWHYPAAFTPSTTWTKYRFVVGPYGGTKNHSTSARYISVGFIANYTAGNDVIYMTGFKCRPIPRYNNDALTIYNNGNVGIGNTAPAEKLHVTGNMVATGEITAYYSDRRLKDNVKMLTGAVDKVMALNGITYTPNELAISFGHKDKNLVGLFADEVEAVLPEAVRLAPFDVDSSGNSKSGENYKTIQYEKLVPLLIEAIKEQQRQIDELKSKLNQNK